MIQKVSKIYDGYAQRVTEYEVSGEVKSDTLEFVFKDILGSPVCTADENGNLKDTFVYEPFGKMIYRDETDSNGVRRTFTGHMLEDDEGLYYCHARWYDATVGRFLQADSVLDGFNRYAYCHNNPITFFDPLGLTRKNPDGTYDYSLGGNPHEGEGSAAPGNNNNGDKGRGNSANNFGNGGNGAASAPATPNDCSLNDTETSDLAQESEKHKYRWRWFKGWKIINDNGTGINLKDDYTVSEGISSKPDKESEDFSTYNEAYNDADKNAFDYSSDFCGPPIKYSYNENGDVKMEVDIYKGSSPVGDGSTNDRYEVNVWTIEER